MTKLKILKTTPKEQIERVQNKVVEDVTEYNGVNDMGKYKLWTGSTEMEYFNIIFVRGVLTISLEEREMLLGGNSVIYYAMTQMLIDVLSKVKNNNISVEAKEACERYHLNEYVGELNDVDFKAVRKILKWKMKSKKVKVNEGLFFEY